MGVTKLRGSAAGALDRHIEVRKLVLAGLRDRWGDAFDPAGNPDLDDIAATYIDAGAEVIVVEERDEIVVTGT